MGLFNSRQPPAAQNPVSAAPVAASSIPILPFDLTKRYDVLCSDRGHDRLYENVRFVCLRTFDRITEYTSGLLCGHLEIEAADGARCLLTSYHIQVISEHGVNPAFKILRHGRHE